MARPKERICFPSHLSSHQNVEKSAAFENRSKQELEKVRVKVAKALNDDMLSLFEQGDHSDMTITNKGSEVKAHRCVLQSRSRHLWQEDWVTTESDSQGNSHQQIQLTGLSARQMADFVRQLYVVSDSALLLEEFLPFFPGHDNVASSQANGDGGRIEASLVSVSDNNTRLEDIEDIEASKSTTPLLCLESAEKVGLDFDNKLLLKDCNCFQSDSYDNNESIKCKSESIRGADKGDHYDNVCVVAERDVVAAARLVGQIDGCDKNVDIPSQSSDAKHIVVDEGAEESDAGFRNKKGDFCDDQKNNIQELLEIEKGLNLIGNNDDIESCSLIDNNIPTFVEAVGAVEGSSLKDEDKDDAECVEKRRLEEFVDVGSDKRRDDLRIDNENGSETSQTEDKKVEQYKKGMSESCNSDSNSKDASVMNELEIVEQREDVTVDIVASSSGLDYVNVERERDLSLGGGSNGVNGGQRSSAANVDILEVQSKVRSELSEVIMNSYALSIPYDTCNSLGKDLLQMYLQQKNCDICLSVDGVKFLTHKCILSARSTYFSAMLGGKWCESEMEEIELQGVSAQAVEQLLLFLYGGVMELCTPSDIMELFVVMDMYGVVTLKHVLEFYVRKDLCHFFHKPCNTCIASASSALNLCHSFYLEELEERCLKWAVKYFTKVWSNKAFAGLPEAVHQKCVQSVLATMTESSVLDVIIECTKLSTSLPRIKWTESILCLTTQLMDSAIEYTSSHFIQVIQAPEFLQWGKVASWKGGSLEEIFNSVIDSLPIDTACAAYQTLVDLKTAQADVEIPDQDVLDLLDSMVKRCEKFLKTHIHQVARSKQWSSVGKSLQSQILENSSYIHLDQLPDPKPRPMKRPLPASLVRPKMSSAAKAPTRSRPSSSSSSPSPSLSSAPAAATRPQSTLSSSLLSHPSPTNDRNGTRKSSRPSSSTSTTASSRQPKSKPLSSSYQPSSSLSTNMHQGSTASQRSSFTSIRNQLQSKKSATRPSSSSSSSSVLSSSAPSSSFGFSSSLSSPPSSSTKCSSKTTKPIATNSTAKTSLDKTRKTSTLTSNTTRTKEVRIKSVKVDDAKDTTRIFSTSTQLSRKQTPVLKASTTSTKGRSPSTNLPTKTSSLPKKQEGGKRPATGHEHNKDEKENSKCLPEERNNDSQTIDSVEGAINPPSQFPDVKSVDNCGKHDVGVVRGIDGDIEQNNVEKETIKPLQEEIRSENRTTTFEVEINSPGNSVDVGSIDNCENNEFNITVCEGNLDFDNEMNNVNKDRSRRLEQKSNDIKNRTVKRLEEESNNNCTAPAGEELHSSVQLRDVESINDVVIDNIDPSLVVGTENTDRMQNNALIDNGEGLHEGANSENGTVIAGVEVEANLQPQSKDLENVDNGVSEDDNGNDRVAIVAAEQRDDLSNKCQPLSSESRSQSASEHNDVLPDDSGNGNVESGLILKFAAVGKDGDQKLTKHHYDDDVELTGETNNNRRGT